ncbi:Hypothetical protein ETEE_3108 [Edwardsiella anguillarum ET080813]|uniref:Uncharacterized protein n=1 Tax=Edwardsiella anguillarum ET080813 TaxID=667120 RepID=A0A076LSB9_9GAMM|nr:Hypothetical protein ETEE_3108 [Edwardsiella anguillarum ET080813]
MYHRSDVILFKYKIFHLERAVYPFIRVAPRDRLYDQPGW